MQCETDITTPVLFSFLIAAQDLEVSTDAKSSVRMYCDLSRFEKVIDSNGVERPRDKTNKFVLVTDPDDACKESNNKAAFTLLRPSTRRAVGDGSNATPRLKYPAD